MALFHGSCNVEQFKPRDTAKRSHQVTAKLGNDRSAVGAQTVPSILAIDGSFLLRETWCLPIVCHHGLENGWAKAEAASSKQASSSGWFFARAEGASQGGHSHRSCGCHAHQPGHPQQARSASCGQQDQVSIPAPDSAFHEELCPPAKRGSEQHKGWFPDTIQGDRSAAWQFL